jgi:large subunit ribosomal protein L17
MRHLKNVRKFNKDREHRKAMFSNMMTSFFAHERITTTLAKAKELRRLSERAITRAKENTLHNKRMLMRRIHERDVIAKLFDEIAPKYKELNGGYTRILKLGSRAGDAADLARIELVDPAESASKKKSKGAPKRSAPKRAPAKETRGEQAQKPTAKAKSTKKTAVKKGADSQASAKRAVKAAAAGGSQTAGPESPAGQASPGGQESSPGQASPDSENPSAGQVSPGGENPSAAQT